jgi:hypothetical protein
LQETKSLIKLIKNSYGWINKSASGFIINWINRLPTFKLASFGGCSSVSISWYPIRCQRSKIYYINIDNYTLNQSATSVYLQFWSHYYFIRYCSALILQWLPLRNISKNTAPDQNHSILINLDKQKVYEFTISFPMVGPCLLWTLNVEGEETAVLSSNVLSDSSLISQDPWFSLEDLLRWGFLII